MLCSCLLLKSRGKRKPKFKKKIGEGGDFVLKGGGKETGKMKNVGSQWMHTQTAIHKADNIAKLIDNLLILFCIEYTICMWIPPPVNR